ncbi:trehalose-phosphatase [Desulfobaculum xiamenense]|uniref:Trehalose 6-phosphate phosphatase n=1 Tax=Desulfobaculum xiamenense TaxID=995050 RepID=A0A846QQD4_9BACT|nr:trehalose-phosphatase [Desulfobaculum xiamenense]NJB66889.1 trehalose-phosphatase [Desulfobaculum xiamenense]
MRTWSEVETDSGFWAGVASAPAVVLVLDYDGTLAPFVANPAEAVPYPGVCEAVTRLMDGERCRVVFVTGRAIDDLLPLLALPRTPEIWGSHGGERLLSDGRCIPPAMQDETREALARAAGMANAAGYSHNLERKPGCIAFHLRSLPEQERAKASEWARGAWGELDGRDGLVLHAFDGGLELRCAGFGKDRAVRTIVEEAPDGAAIFYLGDDLTDEDAFAALAGHGTGIIVRAQCERPSLAQWILHPPMELIAFFQRLTDVLVGRT